MQDFDTVSASSTDPSALVGQLKEKSKDGWHVIAIVPTGGNVTAFLSRKLDDDDSLDAMGDGEAKNNALDEEKPAVSSPMTTPATTIITPAPATPASTPAAPSTPSEPSGWGTAPAASQTAPTPSAPAAAPTAPASAPSFQPANVAPSVVAPAAPAASTPAVPSGWYSDPAGRYELRYWNGKEWTEHVSRGGQQATDPPTR